MKYKDFKTGDYIKGIEDGSIFIVGNRENLLAGIYSEDFQLFDAVKDVVKWDYKTNDVIGDFEYCSDEEKEIINNEMKRQDRVFVQEWGACVPDFVLELRPHDVLRSTLGECKDFIIIKSIDIVVDDGVLRFKIYAYVEINKNGNDYDISTHKLLNMDANDISLYELDCIYDLEHEKECEFVYNKDTDSYEIVDLYGRKYKNISEVI